MKLIIFEIGIHIKKIAIGIKYFGRGKWRVSAQGEQINQCGMLILPNDKKRLCSFFAQCLNWMVKS